MPLFSWVRKEIGNKWCFFRRLRPNKRIESRSNHAGVHNVVGIHPTNKLSNPYVFFCQKYTLMRAWLCISVHIIFFIRNNGTNRTFSMRFYRELTWKYRLLDLHIKHCLYSLTDYMYLYPNDLLFTLARIPPYNFVPQKTPWFNLSNSIC